MWRFRIITDTSTLYFNRHRLGRICKLHFSSLFLISLHRVFLSLFLECHSKQHNRCPMGSLSGNRDYWSTIETIIFGILDAIFVNLVCLIAKMGWGRLWMMWRIKKEPKICQVILIHFLILFLLCSFNFTNSRRPLEKHIYDVI